MKKLFFMLCLLLTTNWLWAQNDSDPQLFLGGNAIQEVAIDNNGAHIYLQVGNPIHYYHNRIGNVGEGDTISVRYLWDVAYIPLTFSEQYFEVSKGYFSDKIDIGWTFQNNANRISQVKIYRRVFEETNLNDVDNYTVIATLSSDSYNYEDFNTQGGILYEYKVEAVNVSSIPKKYVTYITGVGYRNPTGVVSGNISFDGGNPVKDVVVRADPQGANLSIGSSLLFGNTSMLAVALRNKELQNAITLQAWVKLDENTSASLFKLQDNQRTTDEVQISYTTTANSLSLTATTLQGTPLKTVTISNVYPTGNVNGRGDDTFNAFSDANFPISDFAQNFAHVSVILESGSAPIFFLNGRKLDNAYVASLPGIANDSLVSISSTGSYIFQGFETANVMVAEGLQGNIDEVRIWDTVLQPATIRTDFKRYLGGTEVNLISYLRCDEKVGGFAYDISRIGFAFNKNHAQIINGTWSANKPTSSQLGILGVTDNQGNYIISAIPFSGTGESYTITPMYGVHQFEPAQQLVFLGNGAEIINKINFKDISSFDFLGKVYFTTTDVFAPIASVTGVTSNSVTDTGYNQYNAIINGNEQLISKGENYYDTLTDVLYETPKVFLAGANVYIDGQIVLDKDNRPVVTDQSGFFKVRVPIGNHYIEVKSDKHGFTYGGRFPAARADGNDLFDFYEHQQAAVTFLDTTRVNLVGRVVGGSVESAKPIGFGYAGSITETYNLGTPEEETVDISSVNNIGQATIKLSYLPFGGTPGIGELEHVITTNAETGEYTTNVLPLSYSIDQPTGLRIASNASIQLLQANESVNLSAPTDPITSDYINADSVQVFSAPFHFVKSFTYRSSPVLNVISQSSDVEVQVIQDDANGDPQEVSISTEGFQYPVYTQFDSYAIVFETFEEYINLDAIDTVFDLVPIVDGEFIITNNLALSDSEKLTVDSDNSSVSKYIFKAGLPSISTPYTRTIDIKYRVNGQDFNARNYNPEGIILGGQSDGSQTFVTQAPDYPDIILRDPPGSNSSATIESGKSISFTEDMEFNIGQTAETKLEYKLGVKFAAGGGLAGPVIEAESVNNIKAGISLGVESTDGKSINKTYTFNQTISTSDDPAFVGSNADLYIGNSKNYFYGSYDNVKVSKIQLGSSPSLVLTNASGETVNISKQKAFYFSEEPSETFFIYSQNHILTILIPELEKIIEGIDLGTITPGTPGVLTRDQYVEQVRLWKKVIQENERTKYLALYDRENYKNKIKSNLENEVKALDDYLIAIKAIGATLVGGGLYSGAINIIPVGIQSLAAAEVFLNQKKGLLQTKLNFLEDEFLKNISFDAGVGSFTSSNEISIAQSKTRKIKFDINASLETTFGFELNKAGIILNTSNTLNTSMNSALSENESETTTISYTLKDNDANNFLSVDVVNAFDGNGPVFSVIGGRTSCPYEGIDLTLFYNNSEYSYSTDTAGVIYSGGEQISYATQRIEVPGISVAVASVTDVPEARAAEFVLILENNTVTESDATFLLSVDNTTNPNNAIINIAPNGTIVSVPYGQKVEYALTLEKSISDVYEYSDIDIFLSSLCDNISEKVSVSAVFRPSCTAIEIEQPLENWVFNAADAYNVDNSTNPLNIAMFGYDRTYTSFEKFRLEYRKATSSSWTRLRSYYNTQDLLDAAIIEGEDNGLLLDASVSNFSWDIGAQGLSDGDYELRAISKCSNSTEFISNVITGTVDLNVPVQFGTPSPTNGILGPGEDLRLQFSENIQYSSAISKIEIKGETNQQEINHNVSIHFEGANNIAEIEKPNISIGDFSMEFWLLNQTAASGVVFNQLNGLNVTLNSGVMEWTFGGQILSKTIATDQVFHHYTLTYNATSQQLKIYQDDQELGVLNNATGITQQNTNSLIIGGNTFVGNLHDLRFWSKSLNLSEAYAAQFNELTGSERDLTGYWPMNEGEGEFAPDLARFKHAALTAEWDIKPKGTAYEFAGGQHLILDDVGFVQLTNLMDITLSFWIKTNDLQKATIFSNGRGNGDDLVQSNGSMNKWAVSIDNGILQLNSEGLNYILSSSNIANNSWHHVAIIVRRNGSLKTYIDASLESSNPVANIEGLSSNKFWIGARGFVDATNTETVDEVFSGKIDELRLWNLARATEQFDRDRFNEVDFNSIGLMLYARMNEPDPITGSGPKYYHAAANETVLPSNAILSSGSVAYTTDAPKIKLSRPYLSFEVQHVINGDEMIITPLVSDWSVLEGQIIDITVDRMFDVYGNRQASPITWSAFVRRNEVSWFVADGSQRVNIKKQANDAYSFEVTILNKGGKQQPYSIENIPQWLSASNTSGTLEPNSSETIEFNIAPELTIGQYSLDLFLDTDFNFDEKILLDLRVLGSEPDWKVNPSNFEYNMNIIGKIKINGAFSQDPFTMLAAFSGTELRGVANLEYDENYDEYFLYLSVFSNTSSGEEITFKIWDATSGKIRQAMMDGVSSYSFVQNEVLGYKSVPIIFESTSFIDQNLVLNQGWTWVSIFTQDPNLGNLNTLTAPMVLTDNDMIKSQLNFDVYDGNTGWNGSLTNAGGLTTTEMFKVKLGQANTLILGGAEVDVDVWSTPVSVGWNWLSYPLSNNVSTNEALALLDANEGDVIKNQQVFAIYDPLAGWSGTLEYLIAGEGYMLKSSIAQSFRYPNIFNSARTGSPKQNNSIEFDGWSLYENNLNVVAEVLSDEPFTTVWVIDNHGILRGKSKIKDVDGRKLSYITVFGEGQSAEELVFYLGSEQTKIATSTSFNFSPNMLLGTVKDPVILELIDNGFTIYPNAFTKDIRLQFNTKQNQKADVVLMDALGKVVYRKTYPVVEGFNELIVEPNVPQGLYILSVVIDEEKNTFKVVKK
jgi:concanavalin A-like lectin/glucanase superfamily protein